MLKAYAVALVLSTSTQAPVNTQENVRPLEKQIEASSENQAWRPSNCGKKLCRIGY